MRGSHEPTIKTPENKQQFIGAKMAKNPIDRKLFEVEGRKCFVHMFDGRTIKGKVNISPSKRLSEVFTQGQEPFVVIYEATIGDGSKDKTFILNKSGISWVEPEKPVGKPVEAKDSQT